MYGSTNVPLNSGQYAVPVIPLIATVNSAGATSPTQLVQDTVGTPSQHIGDAHITTAPSTIHTTVRRHHASAKP